MAVQSRPTAIRPGRLAPYPSMTPKPAHDEADFDAVLDDLAPEDAVDVLVAAALADAEDRDTGTGADLPPARLGRILHAWAGALDAGSLTPGEVAAALRDLAADLMADRAVGGLRL